MNTLEKYLNLLPCSYSDGTNDKLFVSARSDIKSCRSLSTHCKTFLGLTCIRVIISSLYRVIPALDLLEHK